MRIVLALALAFPLLPACSGGGDAAPEKKEEAAVVAKDPATLFEPGKAALLPAPYKGVKPGMTKEEAVKLLPELAKDNLFRVPEYGDLMFAVQYDDAEVTIDRAYIKLPKATAESIVSAAWGPPTKAKGKHTAFEKTLWWSPEAGLRADLEPESMDWRDLEFTTYLPTDTFLGATDPAFAFMSPGPLLGQTVEAIAAAYGEKLVVTVRDPVTRKSDEVRYVKAADPKPVADDNNDFFLEMPPTDYEDFWTRVHLSFADDGTCERVRFMLPHEGNTAARDAYVGIFKTKFGNEGKEEDKYGTKQLVFSDDPRVVVSDDEISSAVEVELELPKKKKGKGKR